MHTSETYLHTPFEEHIPICAARDFRNVTPESCASSKNAWRPGCLGLQGAKVLLVGDARAFFTMYKSIVDAGLKPFQLDRDNRLSTAGCSSAQLKAAAEQAASAADCILVTPQQIATSGFPFARSVPSRRFCLPCSCLLRYQHELSNCCFLS